MGAQNTRQAQAGLERANNGHSKRALSRRASTGALITRQERLEYSRRSALVSTSTGTTEIGGKAKSSTLSSASSVGCLLTNQERVVKTNGEDTASQSTESSDTARSLTISRSGSGDPKAPASKLPLAKRNSKSLSSRIAPTLKKLAKRSSKTVGAGSSSSIQVATSKLSGREEVATEFLSLRRNEQQRQHHIVEDGDLGAEISKTVEWNGTTLRKSWFNDDHNSSNVSLGRASAASASAESRADSAADVRQQRSASLSSRQCRRAASVGSLLGQSSTLQQPANSSSIDELISTASSTISSLSLTSNGVGGGGMHVRQRCSSQASHAFSTNTNPSRRSSSSSSSLALQSTQSVYGSHQSQHQQHQQQQQQQQPPQQQQGYSRQSSLQSTSSAFTPQSQVSVLNGRSTSRSHSRSSVGTGRFSSPSCSPPLTRAPTKLELLLGFSRCAVARCPGIGARYEDVELWVRGTDRALIKSGWQEQPFLCTGNLVLVYGVFLVALQTETIRTVADLRGIILTCLYIAFTYGGHEISYPLKPFLYTTDRALFWDRCVRIALSSSSLMLQINKKEPLYHDLLISLHDELYTG